MAAFPTDDLTLDLLEKALDGGLTGDGEQSGLGPFLDFMSGYDPAKSVEIAPGVYEYPDACYHPHDVIRALIAEVRRLRS